MLQSMITAEASPETYEITPEMKAELGLTDCVEGDEYTLTVTKVNKDGSLEVSVESETPAEDAAEPAEEKPMKGKNKAMESVMAG